MMHFARTFWIMRAIAVEGVRDYGKIVHIKNILKVAGGRMHTFRLGLFFFRSFVGH